MAITCKMPQHKILIKYPSRQRPERFFKSLDSVYNNVFDPDNFHVACTLDLDDETMNQPEIIERINKYSNISIQWGLSDSKIHAINRDIPNIEWDIICVLSDDIIFNIYGFDQMIRVEMEKHFPEGDGYLHFMEKDTKEALNVMSLMDRKYYNRFGYIYHPSFLSLWADNEQTEVSRILGRYKYIPYSIFDHLLPALGYQPRDEMFNRQQLDWATDEANFNKRKANNFGL